MSGLARRLSTVPLAVLLLATGGLVACGGASVEDAGDEDETVEEHSPAELGAIGGRIYLAPDSADVILESEGLTEEVFAARVRDVATDPEASRGYTEAFRAETGEEGDPGDGLSP